MDKAKLKELIYDLSTEADLCRNETATDIAELLDAAAITLRNLSGEKTYAEGFRDGQLAMREAAAKACEKNISQVHNILYERCAKDIRNIKLI